MGHCRLDEATRVRVVSGARSQPSLRRGSANYQRDAQSDEVFAQEPYASKGQRTSLNAGDNIYQDGGSQLTFALTPAAGGYTTTFDIGVQLA
jgi:hypothetical protein